MSKQSAAPKRRTATPRPSSPPVPPSIHPGQIAFLGESHAAADPSSPGNKATFVQALCWPLTNSTWAALTKSWVTLKALRDGSMPAIKITKGPLPPPSWVYTAVPTLGAPFRDNPAEESTLAAWVSRAQVSIALSVIQADPLDARTSNAYGTSIPECLSGYLEFLKFPGYEPCQLILAGPLAATERQQLTSALAEARKRYRDTPSMQRVANLPVRTCTPGEVPLPVDFANLVSVAVARYVSAPAVANPVFDALRPKLVLVPRRIAALEGHRRR